MKSPGRMSFLLACVALVSFVILSACSSKITNDEFSFSTPPGFKTKEYDSNFDVYRNADNLIYTAKGHLYFQIFRQVIPQGSDLESISSAYISKVGAESSHFQLISHNLLEVNDQPAIEYIYRVFHGEPYVQIREVWLEHNGAAFTLFCSEPVIATTGLAIPVAEECYQLADGFKLK